MDKSKIFVAAVRNFKVVCLGFSQINPANRSWTPLLLTMTTLC